jgi:hypothetical protein
MATKKHKPRRFNEGDLVSDKEAGLKASQGEKVGFFERLRMGNIDDEGSEAYRRFGAGRGKAERTPVETMAATSVSRPMAADPEMDEMEAANAREPIPVSAGPRADQPKPGGRPRVNVQAAKSSASTKSSSGKSSAYPMTKAQPATKTYDRSGGPTADELANYKPTARNQSLASKIPDAGNPNSPAKGEQIEPMSDAKRNLLNIAGVAGIGGGVAGLLKLNQMSKARKAAQAGARKRANLKRDVEEGIDRNLADEVKSYSQSAAEKAIAAKQNAADRTRDLAAGQAKTKFTSESKKPSKTTKKFDDNESNIEFKRGGKVKKPSMPIKKMASGGMTSRASSRGDGIAQRGKTRGKIY